MNILVVGSGGREHAVIKKLRENSEVKKYTPCPETAASPQTQSAST